MASPIEKLIKFLKLEADRGFDNKAVVGGLEKIIPSWQNEARNYNIDSALIEKVSNQLGSYHVLNVSDREGSIKSLLPLLQGLPALAEPEHNNQDRKNSTTAPGPSSNTGYPTDSYKRPSNRPDSGAQNSAHHPRSRIEETTGTIGLNAPVTVLPGVGHQNAKSLSELGIETLGDLLYYFPRRYDNYSQLKPINKLTYGEIVTIIASVQSISTRQVNQGKMQITEAVVGDGTGFLRISWFNKPWLEKQIRVGQNLSISGKTEIFLGRLVMNSPEWETVEQEHINTNRIVPVYPSTAHLRQNYLRRILNQTVRYWASRVPDPIPAAIRSQAELYDLRTALLQIHFPDTMDTLRAARSRLAFDEIFYLQLGVLKQKQVWQSFTAERFEVPEDWIESIVAGLPYVLTNAQLNALNDIRRDLSSGKPMNRLIQGDVGSGKTIIAAIASAVVNFHGGQAAIMAPTGILAEQHYRNFMLLMTGGENHAPLLSESEIRLLVGSTPENEKEEIRTGLSSGTIRLVIGTHALIEDPIEFNNLQFVVIDEQHRFGVEQRAALRTKGKSPHLLVMTATPIPRSLALTVYGDLDLSVMDELPAGRQPVETHVIHPLERERCYHLIRSQVQMGHQAFVIYPLVELGERDEGAAAVEESERLQKEIFPDLRIGLLHGRMKPDEKDAVMVGFRNKEYDILVSTSVIEVGVDVPNATVMLIEGANRFGLAQLHQFRGRVGRGSEQSFCLLIPETENALENERLAVMAETNDGFVLAERDLEQRGPGDFLGTRQAGFAELKLANLMDVRLIEKARRYAEQIFIEDPDLASDELKELKRAVDRFWGTIKGDIS